DDEALGGSHQRDPAQRRTHAARRRAPRRGVPPAKRRGPRRAAVVPAPPRPAGRRPRRRRHARLPPAWADLRPGQWRGPAGRGRRGHLSGVAGRRRDDHARTADRGDAAVSGRPGRGAGAGRAGGSLRRARL
ncbi:MAG: hypothetical protein AVDCRST_MAG38-555, partial [uncultured Solirubrobacteraceae bacterium]